MGIPKRRKTCLAFREFADATERNPGKVGHLRVLRNRGKKKAYDRHGKSGRDESIEENPTFTEQAPWVPNELVSIESKLSAFQRTNALLERQRHGRDRQIGQWFDQRLQLAAPIRDAAEIGAAQHGELVLCVRQRRAPVFLLQLATGILLALI